MTEASLSLPSWVAWCAAHVVLAMATHELGHALVSTLVGGRVWALGWGHPSPGRCVRILGLRLFARPPWLSGFSTWSSPPRAGWTRASWSLIVAAGPAVNLLLGAVLWWAQLPVASVIHLLHAVVNLVPAPPSGRAPSDGTQLWRLFRRDTPPQAALGGLEWRPLLAAAHAFRRWDCPAMATVVWAHLAESCAAHRPLLSQRARARAAGSP